MNNVVKTMLITLAINMGAEIVLLIPLFSVKGDENINVLLFAFIVGVPVLLIQLIAAILMAVGGDRNKQTGTGMLLALGAFLVIGPAIFIGAAGLSH